MAYKYDIQIQQGSTFNKLIRFTDENDDPIVNINSYQITGQIRKYYTSNTYVNFAVEVIDEPLAIININLDHTITKDLIPGRYVYDLEFEYDSTVTRFIEGVATVSPEVTR